MAPNSEMQCRIAGTIDHVSSRTRALRMERGITVKELADRCGIERSNLSRLEAGRTSPTLRTLCMICYAIDAEPVELFAEERGEAVGQTHGHGKNSND